MKMDLLCHIRLVWPAVMICIASTGLAQPIKELSSPPGQMSVGGNQPAGVYEVTFRLQTDKTENSVTPLATLTVGSPEYPDIISRVTTPFNFDSASAPKDFKFIFDNFKAQNVLAAVVPARNNVPVPKLSVERISIAPVRSPCLGTVWPGKILYRTGEEARGFVAVYNGDEEPRTVTLRCVLESDIARVRPLKDEQITLAAGERREVPLTWNTGQEEYGFALAATLLDAGGKEICQGREYFSVADNLWKVGLSQSGRGCSVPSGPGPNPAIPVSEVKKYEKGLAAELVKPFTPVYWNYANFLEYSWGSPDSFFVQAPEPDYWYTGMGNYTMGKRWIQMSIEWLHRRGMRAVNYMLPGSCGYGGDEVYRKHPEWFAYEKNGQLAAGSYNEKLLEIGSRAPGSPGTEKVWETAKSGNALWLAVNFADPAPIDAFIDQVVKSREMFGWDGIRFDVAPFLVQGYDFHGKKIDDNDPKKKSELEVRAWTHMRDTLWKRIGPDFAIGLNSDRDLYYDQYPELWDECCRKGQLLMEEVPRSSYSSQSARNRWYDYMVFYRGHGEIVRGLGGHHMIIGLDSQYPVDQLYLNVITYAMRAHPFCYQYSSDGLPLGNYAQFITRYSALIWDIDTVRTLPDPEKTVTIRSALPIWWRELACVRQTPEGKRQYIIHLVNPPAQERIYTDATNKVPGPVNNIQVTVKNDGGEKITRAWLLSADPATRQENLAITRGNGQSSVTVPRLYFWNIVVLEGDAK